MPTRRLFAARAFFAQMFRFWPITLTVQLLSNSLYSVMVSTRSCKGYFFASIMSFAFFRDTYHSMSIPYRLSFLSSLLLQRLTFFQPAANRVVWPFYRLSVLRDRLSFSISCRSTFLSSVLLNRDRLSFSIPCRITILSSLLLQRQAFLQHIVS